MKLHRFNPQHKRNTLFFKVLTLVGAIMTGALVLLASMIVQQAIFPKTEEFEAPKPMENPDVKKVKRKVVMQKSNKRSNNVVKRINVPKVQQVTPQFTIALPSGKGGEDGGGIGFVNMGGMSLDKMEIEIPTMEIFGVKGTSDKVLICFDVTSKTMTEDMGALPAFNVVKNEISTLVRNLPATSIFNVMCFDCERGQNPDGTINCVSVFRDSLVPANAANKSAFESWMEPINKSELRVGIQNGQDNYKLRYPYVPFNEGFAYQATTKDGWRNNVWQRHAVVFWYMAYQAAIEQGADVIFFLTTHWPRPDEYWKPLDDKAREKYIADTKKNSEEFERKGGKLVSEEVKSSYYAKAREAAKILIAAENVERAKKGIPPMVVRDPWGYAAKNRIPEAIEAMKRKTWQDFSPLFKFKTYSQSELFAFYEPIYKKMYDERHLKRPQFNMIIMLPKTDDGSWNKAYGNNARKWARANRGGAVKILRGAKPISEYDRSIKKVKAPAKADASAANKTKKAEDDEED